MKKILTFSAFLLICFPIFGADSNPRRTNAAQWTAAQRSSSVVSKSTVSKSSIRVEDVDASITDNYEEEKNTCLENNVGTGNTFVWASKYSDTSNYALMTEDVDNLENNVCFVKVELSSSDSKINLSDIDPIYYQFNNNDDNIVCGSWVDDKMLENRILDAKKSSRTWGTVAGVVGGAAVGVGSMELFGNRLIGGKVQGQKDLQENNYTAWIRSELLQLKKKDQVNYDKFITNLQVLKTECDKLKTEGTTDEALPKACKSFDYETLLSSLDITTAVPVK